MVAPIKSFSDKIKELYIDYLEAKLPNLTPHGLLKIADDKTEVLKHAGQWAETEPPAVMALKSQLEAHQAASTKGITQLMAHIGNLQRRPYHRPAPQHSPVSERGKRSSPDDSSSSYPAWMITPPRSPAEVKCVKHRVYTWCPKCR
jgi:hypothetical protein